MVFKWIQLMEIWEILRRWHDGQSISSIATSIGCDRKTVRSYIRLACDRGVTRQTVLERKNEILPLLQAAIEQLHSKAAKQALLASYLEEILSLVNNTDNPLKPKTAFEVICQRHDLTGKVSYSSFKRLARADRISTQPDRTTCRIELPPGQQLQVDYGRMGLLLDPVSGRRRLVHAFIGTLSFSRHKAVEFVFSQDQQSFVKSHVTMFESFGGVTNTIVIDNLKSGVLTLISTIQHSTEPMPRWPNTTTPSSIQVASVHQKTRAKLSAMFRLFVSSSARPSHSIRPSPSQNSIVWRGSGC